MPPKRKASTNGGRSSKRASGAATPQSLDSSDEFSDGSGDEGSASESEELSKAVKLFSAQARKPKAKIIETEGRPPLRDYSELVLKSDHENRPLFIDADKNRIVLESFSPLAQYAQDFLITIAEPISRPSLIHEFVLTTHSLYAAVSVGLSTREIINTLNTLSKTPLPEQMVEFIELSTKTFGKVKLVLKSNKYFMETSDPTVLQSLMKDEIISSAIEAKDIITEAAPSAGGMVLPGTKEAAGIRQQTGKDRDAELEKEKEKEKPKEQDDILLALRADEDEDEEEQSSVHSIHVPGPQVEVVQKRCLDMGFPVLEEYDFRNDVVNPNLVIDLKPGITVRSYQEKSLAKMFGNGRARSGIIVLPCGAGKTLVGVTAACTVRKGCIVLCTSAMSVVQWRNEFLKWSNINPSDVAVFTSEHKDKFPGATGIVISTYTMLASTNKRSHDTQKMMDFLTSREWGLMILDEVHVSPAEMFRKVTHNISAHSKLGLTATLVREDDKITDLNFLIGPKLYEANWMELAEQGHIAKVQCAEVWCAMTTEFYTEYLRETSKKRGLLWIMNPRKFQACQYLIDFHEKRGDKIIVFSDNVYALKQYALKLGKAYIYGETPQNERLRILENFQHNEQVNTIFLSKIGDTSLDLPEATCLIQISSHYASRRQEAQRLGRILRAKRRNDEGFNAFFYSLVSKDTQEMYYSSKRQAFLVDQGYSFKVITHLQGIENLKDLAYASPSERRELLQEVMLQNESAAGVEHIEDDIWGRRKKAHGAKGARRTAGTLSELSGGRDMAYIEYNKSRNKELKAKNGPLFKKMAKEQQKRKAAITDMG